MSKKPEYYTDYVDGDYDPTLFGPDGFECYLGEPEDRTFYRDAAPMVNKLNEQADRIKELESRTQWQDIETAPKDGTSILLLTTCHGVCEAWFAKGEWSEETPDMPREYDGDCWVCCDDAFQIEVEIYNDKPEYTHHGTATHWMPLPESP